ncbi:3-oxoacyl-ACP reductase [Flavobacterium sp.]|uniref:3-oxoacyl-ACP reductase n=1 Tax=Flavobacterium sp. TaxID=239 RepID=UPI00286BE833|nr:3-oxoacyl-ACP reductase [Flavobacterium sp.]
MKKAILTFGLFSLVMILTSFTTPENTTTIKVENKAVIEYAASSSTGNKKIDTDYYAASSSTGNKKIDRYAASSSTGNKKVDRSLE